VLAEDFVISVENGNIFGNEGYITPTASSDMQKSGLSDLHVRVCMGTRQ